MKKIYIALAAVFVLLTALMIIYRITNPPQATPSAEYTRVKAELLLHNYRQAAEDSGEEVTGSPADHSVIYAVMVETPLDGQDAVACFSFFDHYGTYIRLKSNNGDYVNVKDNEELARIAKQAVADVAECFDETYSRAKKSSYDVPYEGEIKIYVRAGDGVFCKTFKAEETPKELVDAYGIAREAAAQTEDRSE